MANPQFPRATFRDDPYKSYKFRLKWEGQYVAGISKVSALTHTTQVVTYREGGDPTTPRRMPGQSEYAPITLERGVTHDTAFEQSANKVRDYHNVTTEDPQSGTGNEDASLQDFRRDIVLEVYSEAGQKVLAYTIYRCWPSEFRAVPEMDADGNAVAIESLTLENEGWKRDTTLPEPPEPSFTLPANS
jgi:phage tail-like protein